MGDFNSIIYFQNINRKAHACIPEKTQEFCYDQQIISPLK